MKEFKAIRGEELGGRVGKSGTNAMCKIVSGVSKIRNTEGHSPHLSLRTFFDSSEI